MTKEVATLPKKSKPYSIYRMIRRSCKEVLSLEKMAYSPKIGSILINIHLRCYSNKLPIVRTICTTACVHAETTELIGDEASTIIPTTQVPARPPLPIYTSRKLTFPTKYEEALQAWVCNMDTLEEEKLGIIDLHRDVYGVMPKLATIHENFRWQSMYRKVNWTTAKTRAEMPGGGRKPWPQKGTGRARQGSIRAPHWIRGGKAHGPRGPTPYFYMLHFHTRISGLTSTLSIKIAQDDLHIVDSLDIPSDEPQYIEQLVEKRNWGLSVLFVDDTDIMPHNITMATDKIPHFNLMPAYGLNVFSMLKYDTLVLTVAAIEKIEERILFHLHRTDYGFAIQKFNRTNYGYSPLQYAHLYKDQIKQKLKPVE